ncbi:MAG TPA: hypothetical protein VNJ01_10085 [Bacteriovoracaceae bacterium]|nr:hypothetical protein [Bacteriovoracaceae bacterium]
MILNRYFNRIFDHGEYLEKRSLQKDKLRREYEFLTNLPVSIEKFFPEAHGYIDDEDSSSYNIRKIPTPDASYLLLNEDLYSDETVTELLTHVFSFIELQPKKNVSRNDYETSLSKEIIEKNRLRYNELLNLPFFEDLNELSMRIQNLSLAEFTERLNAEILCAVRDEPGTVLSYGHGDLCFSNMLFDGTRLLLIDPKGANSAEDNYRPVHYELAKISQSLFGHYDSINHGFFEITEDSLLIILKRRPVKAQNLFKTSCARFGTDFRTVSLIESSLFLSLIPFHIESKKKVMAFLLNSINIFQRFK